MNKLPPSVQEKPIAGLNRIHQGKVRDTYEIPGYPDLLLIVTTDRISIFDVVLPALIPSKGEILNAINIWWRSQLLGVASDIVCFGPRIDLILPEKVRGIPELHRRAVVVKKLRMLNAELIVRGYLTGSAYTAYQKTAPNHEYCGNDIPQGLRNWSPLFPPLFTPTTKEESGHDKAMNIYEFNELYGFEPIDRAIKIYSAGRNIAAGRGIALIDTKFEFGYYDEELRLGDECLTPDSSRYVLLDDLERVQADSTGKTSPKSLDKQPVRDWGMRELGLGPSTELTSELIERIHNSTIPNSIIEETMECYNELFIRLVDMWLPDYQQRW